MYRILPVSLLLASAAIAQGVPRPPAFNPVTDSPVTTGQPGENKRPSVPRTISKRVLPETPETRQGAGIWAATTPLREPLLLGILLPYPESSASDADKEPTRTCAEAMDGLANPQSAPFPGMQRWTREERRCVASMLFRMCADDSLALYRKQKAALQFMDEAREAALAATAARAKSFQKEACADVAMTPDMQLFFALMNPMWQRQMALLTAKQGVR